MTRWTLTAGLSLLALGGALAAAKLLPREVAVEPVAEPSASSPRDVDIVLCLDTSGSMSALIDSARARLWDVVNEVAQVEPDANLRVGLLSYGSPGPAGSAAGYVVLQSSLTSDLDALYGRMQGLSTDGGDEYVGWVLDDALQRMPWSTDDNAAHLVFVAGNESALQGPKDAIAIARQARERGFKVNTLYAGDERQGISEHWPEVANAGGGRFTAISMADGLVQVETPHDAEIQRLNDELNGTYVPFGTLGQAKKRRQTAQDANARSMGFGSAATRTLAKGTRLYKNADWDLVDATDGGLDVESVPEASLPAEMRAMRPSQRKAYVDELAAKRAEIRLRMQDRKLDREKWVEENVEEGEGLGVKMKEMVAEQL